jgi:hypothetical protein
MTTADVLPAMPLRWTWNQPGPIRIGSEEHKRLFCRMLLDTFDPYKPAVMDWPTLSPDALARIKAIPFWDVAVETEDTASANIASIAATERDPLIREALELMSFEERRHREVIGNMIAFYGVTLGDITPYNPTSQPEFNFLSTGYGECLDSFFAFGLFELARQSGYFPRELVETFEPVIQEEARHLVFFINWVTYTQANKPLHLKPWFLAKRLFILARNGWLRAGIAGDLDGKPDTEFAQAGREALDIDVGLKDFVTLCLAENDRRMRGLDSRLLRPTILPTLARLARPLLPNG